MNEEESVNTLESFVDSNPSKALPLERLEELARLTRFKYGSRILSVILRAPWVSVRAHAVLIAGILDHIKLNPDDMTNIGTALRDSSFRVNFQQTMLTIKNEHVKGVFANKLLDAIQERNEWSQTEPDVSTFRRLVSASTDSHLLAEMRRKLATEYGDLNGFKANSFAALGATLGGAETRPVMLTILERYATGWYQESEEMFRDLCDYFSRARTRKAFDPLLTLFLQEFNLSQNAQEYHCRALGASIKMREMNQFMGIIARRTDQSPDSLIRSAAVVLANVDSNLIDPERLFSNENVIASGWGVYLVQRNKAALTKGKSILFKMMRDDKTQRRDFALSALRELGVADDEVLMNVGTAPVVEVLRQFLRPDDNVFDSSRWTKENLGGALKGNVKRLDFYVDTLLKSAGCLSFLVDHSHLKGVDIITFVPSKMAFLMIGCTTGTPKDDVQKLMEAVGQTKAQMDLVPVVATVGSVDSMAQQEFLGKQVYFWTQPDLEGLSLQCQLGKGRETLLKMPGLSLLR